MLAIQCSCGFTELADEEITDHLALVFVPNDSTGKDGKKHEELPGRACSCGFAGITPEELEAHLIEIFTPSDGIGLDGKKHKVRESP
jgi:hypothetical protein